MLDSQIQLLQQARCKSQLSPREVKEYCVRFGLAAYCNLPDHPDEPTPRKKSAREIAAEVLG